MDRRVLCRPGLPQDMRPFQVPPGQWQVHLLKSHAVLLQLDPVMSFYGGRHCYIYFHPLTFFKVTARTNARELHFSMTLINASGARSFYYQICFCCLKIFRQKNLRRSEEHTSELQSLMRTS